MDNMDNLINSIKEKLGDEASAIISDDLGLLITENNNIIEKTKNLANDIEKMKSRNESLVSANSRLLQQIPMVKDEEEIETPKEEKKSFNLFDLFDSSGRFKRNIK